MLFREWNRTSLFFSGAYTQNQSLGHGNKPKSTDTLVQYFPELNAYAHKGRPFQALPLEFEASANAAYLYREAGERGSRLGLRPKLTLPLTNEYGSVLLSTGLHSIWYRTASKNPGTDKDYIATPFFDIKASTELVRLFDLNKTPLTSPGDSRWSSIKHSVIPRIDYYKTAANNNDILRTPFYDNYDEIFSRHGVTYSLDSTLTRKRERLLPRKTADGRDEIYIQTDYREFFRLHLEQTYNIEEAARDNMLTQYTRRPFGDIIAEGAISLDTYITLRSRSDWSPYIGGLTRHSHGITLDMPQINGRFFTGFDFRRKLNEYSRHRQNSISMVRVNGSTTLYGPWSTAFYYNWDIKGNAETEKGLALKYTHQCFSITGTFDKNQTETNWGITFSLTGL